MQDLKLVVAGHPAEEQVAVADCSTHEILPGVGLANCSLLFSTFGVSQAEALRALTR